MTSNSDEKKARSIATDSTVVIGVAGASGSGKTTICEAILDGFGPGEVLHLQHDAYYWDLSHLSVAERDLVNFDHPDSLETSLLVDHVEELIAGRSVDVPIYDFATHTRLADVRREEPRRVILLEGILVLAEEPLRDLLDVRIYVDTEPDLRLMRRLRRDIAERGRTMESVLDQYDQAVRPMHLQFGEPSKRYADLIIPEGHNQPAVDTIVAMIRSRI